jgi:Na+-transporting NADH:ubiquinone oxidoreductase subunit NqrC
VKQVVAADLDLRDLYRNLVETKMDDAQAELYQTDDHMNVEEFQSLLQEVNDAYRQWFALISESDVRAAEEEAMTSPTTE